MPSARAPAGRTRLSPPAGIVLALGAGGAQGIAHVGVLQVLAEHGIPVRAVAGTSIGAEIGAFLASGMDAAAITSLATRFDWKQTLQLFMPDLAAGGLVSGQNIVDFLHDALGRTRIEELPLGYVAVATDLDRGEQVVFDSGSTVDAVRASISIPGLIAPFELDGRLLIDGSVVNPLPVDVALARFGRPIVAVAVDAASQRRADRALPMPVGPGSPIPALAPKQRSVPARRALVAQVAAPGPLHRSWSTMRVLERALAVTRVELVRQRLLHAPPDLTIAPAVQDIGLLEFYRADEAIAAGRRAALDALPAIVRLTYPGA
ncbi:MAG: patatin-like phospholipase family protein [Gammaproteobacteria bacterium]